jgi:hypothetical protein
VGFFVIWNSSFRPYSRLVAIQSAVSLNLRTIELGEFSCSRPSVRGAAEGRHARLGIRASHSEAATVQTKQPPRGFRAAAECIEETLTSLTALLDDSLIDSPQLAAWGESSQAERSLSEFARPVA